MSNNPDNPFGRLDKSRFPEKKEGDRGPRPPKAPPVPETGETDDAALFLRAVGAAPPPPPEDAEEDARLFAEHAMGRSVEPAPPAKRSAASPPPVPDAFSLPPDDAALFAEAVSDVAPVRARGRDLSPRPAATRVRPHGPDRALENFLAGKIEFALEHTDEFIEGHVLGIAPLVLAKLKAGHYSHEGHLDLHGQNMEQAFASLSRFLKSAYQDGKRNVLLVTGRGKNSPGGDAVLRERVQSWLTRDPFKRVILAFCTAQPRDGGAGALYLLLRKRKKSQGKIIWDRTPSLEELLL